jgi:hypothetical protein
MAKVSAVCRARRRTTRQLRHDQPGERTLAGSDRGSARDHASKVGKAGPGKHHAQPLAGRKRLVARACDAV